MKTTLLLLFSLLSTAALAQRRHPIDIAYQKCLAKDAATGDGMPGGYRTCDGEVLSKWNSELARLVIKIPSQHKVQLDWVRQCNQHVAQMKIDAKESTGLKRSASDDELSMGTLDEIRWYRIDATRKRVLKLTKLAKEQAFILPKE